MAWWKKLFASDSEEKSVEPQLTELQRFACEQAVSLMELMNESLQISNKSTNPETKVSRLELARAKLDSLELIASQHPFIKLERLDEVRKTISLLAEEFSNAGYYRQTDESCREYRQDVWRGIQIPIDDIAKGWQFSATIQLRTPLRVLLRHKEVHEGLGDPPPIAKDLWEGFWLPKLKTFREMGIDLEGSMELNGTMASDVGQIPNDGGEYLKLLVRLRKIVESDLSIEQRRMALWDELHNAEWTAYCAKLGGNQAICNRFFPPFIETITGLPGSTVETIRTIGLTTPDALSAATDTELLAIKGIGPAKLKAVRAACADAQHPASEFVDIVVR